VEILVHPEAPDRTNVVCDLAGAALCEAALRKQLFCALLIDPEDAPAAVAAGFNTTGKRYSDFLWAREGEKGYQSTAIAFERWYEKINQRYGHNGRRFSEEPRTSMRTQVY
jgi:hypothetical protein